MDDILKNVRKMFPLSMGAKAGRLGRRRDEWELRTQKAEGEKKK